MTSPDQPVQPSQNAHDPSEHCREPSEEPRQPAGRFPGFTRKSGRLWITLSVVAFVALSATLTAVILIAVGSGNGTHQATLSGSSPGTQPNAVASGSSQARQSANGISKTSAKVVSAAKLAAGGGALVLPAGAQSTAVTWHSGPGGTYLAAVTTEFGDALQAAGVRQYPEMKNACVQLAARVATAEAGPKIPDATMQVVYARALAELAEGAANCRMAISSRPSGDESLATHVDVTRLKLSVSELSAGARDIFRATAEIDIASRQDH